MKRFLFYLIFAAVICGVTYVTLYISDYLPPEFRAAQLGRGNENGYETVASFFKDVTDGKFSFNFKPETILLYALVLFVFINATILITMVLTFLFTFGRLSRIIHFYRIVGWFCLSSLIVSIAYTWFVYDITEKTNVQFNIDSFHLLAFVPIVVSTIMIIIAGIFRGTERLR